MNILKELSNTQINNYLGHYKLYNGCYGCLHLPNTIKNGVYVINIDRVPGGSGTHWVSVINEPKRIIYFDPYGETPNTEIYAFMEKAKKPMYYNTDDYQALRSEACGYYSCYVCSQVLDGRKFESVMKDFGNNTHANERYLDAFFKS